MTLQYKTSHMGQFFKTELMCFSEGLLNKLSKDVWINGIDQVFTEIRAFRAIRSDVSTIFLWSIVYLIWRNLHLKFTE